MVLSKTQQYKVILLLAGYLFIVLNHLYFVEPPKKAAVGNNYSSATLAATSYDKLGRCNISFNKPYKSVVNRDVDGPLTKALHRLYVAKLLYNATPLVLNTSKLSTYAAPTAGLVVERIYPLRI